MPPASASVVLRFLVYITRASLEFFKIGNTYSFLMS